MRGIDDEGPPVLVCTYAGTPSMTGQKMAVEKCICCERQVQFGPSAPVPHRPICVECYFERVEKSDIIAVTGKQVAELCDFALTMNKDVPKC